MRAIEALLISLAALVTAATVHRAGGLAILWIVNLYSAALVLSAISPISVARRALYLTASLPHISLFSASIATIAARYLHVNLYLFAVLMNVFMVFLYQYLLEKGVDQEIVTSVILSLTTSMSVISLYYLYRNIGYAGQISALFLGDPLLVSKGDATISMATAVICAIFIFATWREQVMLGVDREYAYTAGLRSKLYDYVFYAILAMASIIYLRTVGYILLHVLLLLPGSIAVISAPRMSYLLLSSIGLTMFATSFSLYMGLYLNVSPVGLIGLFMLTSYIMIRVLRRG